MVDNNNENNNTDKIIIIRRKLFDYIYMVGLKQMN